MGHARAMRARDATEVVEREPRGPAAPRVRDVEPYVSPQLAVVARLNTNECPQPLPEDFSDALADEVAICR